MSSLACILMASGISKRFGSNKLLADFAGQPLIQSALDTTAGYPFARRIVVTRHPEIAALCHAQEIEVVLHEKELRNEAIALGIDALTAPYQPPMDVSNVPCQKYDSAFFAPDQPPIDGCCFCLSDQPLLSVESLTRLCHAFSEDPKYIHRLSFEGTPGNPVIFPRALFPELMTLPEKAGGGYLIKKNPGQVRFVPARNAYELMDIDTPDDLSELLFLWKNHI